MQELRLDRCVFASLTKLKEIFLISSIHHFPTRYDVTERLPTVRRLLADYNVGRHFSLKHNENCWPAVGRLSTNSRLTVLIGQQLSDRRPTITFENCSSLFPAYPIDQ